MSTTRLGPGTGIALAVGLLVIAFFAGQAGLELYRNVQVVREWPSTTGEILSGSISAKRERRIPLTRRDSYQHWRDLYRYSSHIAYRYKVEGVEYVSTQISMTKKFDTFLATFSGTADASYEGTWLAKYPVGKKVPVYYNPDDPAEALLERDEAGLAYLFFALAGVLAFMGLGVLNALRHAGKENQFA